MTAIRKLNIVLLLGAALTGCATPAIPPTEPPGVSNHVRKEIHRLAVRGPTAPTVSLTSDLDGKGAATGKTAMAAGAVWLGGTMQAAGDSAEAAPLVLALGLVTTPFAVAGGALYGAAVADSAEAIAQGNQTLSDVLDFAPDRFRVALERQFAAGAPIDYAFTPEASDQELAARGFDAVLDIRMDSLASAPSDNRLRTHFTQSSRAELRIFNRPDLDTTRHYNERLTERAVSSWAKNDGRQLLADLDASYAETASEVVDDFFLQKAIRVQGIEPVSKGWSAGTISGTVPLFVWSARDGARQQPDDDVSYEVMIYAGRKAPESGTLTKTTRYVPPEPLQACRTYNWRVRAHYESFGQPAASDWSPDYRFKTPCKRGKR